VEGIEYRWWWFCW